MSVFSVCSITMSNKIYDIESLATATKLRPHFKKFSLRCGNCKVVLEKMNNGITGGLPSSRVCRKKMSENIKFSAVNSSAISSLSTPTLGVRVKEEIPTDESVGLDDDKIDNLQRIIDLVAIGAIGGNPTIDNCAKQYDGNKDSREKDSADKKMEDPVMGSPLMNDSVVIENPSVIEDRDNETNIEDVVMKNPVTEDRDNEQNIRDVVMEDYITDARDNENNIDEESQLNVNEKSPVIETRAEFLRRLQDSVSLYDQLYIIYYNEERLPFLLKESETVTRVLLALLNNYRLELVDKIANVLQLDAAAIDEQHVYGDYKNLVMDKLLLQHLWHRVSQEDFWQLIFPRMCDIAFFSNVPQTVHEQKTLFASTRLNILKNQHWEAPQNSDANILPEDKIASIMGEGDGDHEDEQRQTASAEINDRVPCGWNLLLYCEAFCA